MTAPPNPYAEASELVKAGMLNIARAAGRLDNWAPATGGPPATLPPEYYELNRVWLKLEELARELDRKARAR